MANWMHKGQYNNQHGLLPHYRISAITGKGKIIPNHIHSVNFVFVVPFIANVKILSKLTSSLDPHSDSHEMNLIFI